MADEMVNPAGTWEVILEFLTDFDKMFPKFREIIEQAQIPFYMVAFVIVVYALVKKLAGAGRRVGGHFKAAYGVLVIAVMVCLCNPLIKLADGIMRDISGEMVGSTNTQKLIEQKQNALVSYIVNDIVNTPETSSSSEDRGALYYMFNWGEAVDKGVDQLIPSFIALEIKAACGFLIFMSKLASIVQWGFWLLQQFLVAFSMIFLPAFIAMLAVPTLASNAVRYIMGFLGFLAWPIGFGLVNVGTIALIEAVFTHLQTSAETLDATTYVWAVIVACSIPLWMIVGAFVAPLTIQKMVAAGGQAAAGLMGQVGAAAVGGAALAATGVVGAIGSGGGGSGSGTGSGGGSGSGGSSTSGTGGGGGGSNDVGRNPQTLASQRITGGGSSLGETGSTPSASEGGDSSSESAGGGGSSGGSSSRSTGRGQAMANAVIGGLAAVASQPFRALAADSGAPVDFGPTMAERVQRSQSLRSSAPVTPLSMSPSSAIAREAVSLRRAQNA